MKPFQTKKLAKIMVISALTFVIGQAYSETATVSNPNSLLAALNNPKVDQIIIQGKISAMPSFRLAPGQQLKGDNNQSEIIFNQDGVELTKNNQITSLILRTPPKNRAIYNDAEMSTLGTISLVNIKTEGQVQIIAKNKVKSGTVNVDGLDIISADTLNREEKPQYYGVKVLQGAFTLWNMQNNPNSKIAAKLMNISVGRDKQPVFGSGIFVSGAGYQGGKVTVSELTTGQVFSNGKIKPFTPDVITGGVFVLYGVTVNTVENLSPVTTYGANDMVLDNWGTVNHWRSEQNLTSFGPSGIGFVNFGKINQLIVKAPIETYGIGARGFNVYTGTVDFAKFNKITTHGDGAVGVQISQPIGTLIVDHGILTAGGSGKSLVKGVVKTLSAIGLSVQQGGSAKNIVVNGGIKTMNKSIAPIVIQGQVLNLNIINSKCTGSILLHRYG